MSIGEELKKLREQSGLSVKEAGFKSSVSRQTYEAYEQGKRDPSTKTLEKLAYGLGYKVVISFKKVK